MSNPPVTTLPTQALTRVLDALASLDHQARKRVLVAAHVVLGLSATPRQWHALGRLSEVMVPPVRDYTAELDQLRSASAAAAADPGRRRAIEVAIGLMRAVSK